MTEKQDDIRLGRLKVYDLTHTDTNKIISPGHFLTKREAAAKNQGLGLNKTGLKFISSSTMC